MTALRKPALLLAAALLLAPALLPRAAFAEGADKKPKGAFEEIPGLGASIQRPEGGMGVMTVEAGLDIPDPKLHDLADMDLPRLHDAYAMALQAYGGELSPGHLPDVDYIGRQLQAATDRVLGRPGARVLLGGVMVN